MTQAARRFSRIRYITILAGSAFLLLFAILGLFRRIPITALHAQATKVESVSAFCQAASVASSTRCTQPHTSPSLLAIYALAFDNEPGSPGALSAYYTSTVQRIISATTAAPNRVAVILADLDGYGDTHVIIAQNGVRIPVEGLPFAGNVGTPNTGLHEYDMSDGWYLGNFIRWARQLYPITNTIFSFVGHGAPLTPQIQPLTVGLPDAAPTTTPTPISTPIPQNEISPLPPRWGAHSDFTDYHSASLISVQALAQALRIGSDNGNDPLAVVDLLHCFSATIEELYEVHPYAKTIIAAPNYTYAQPTMLGETLATLDPVQNPSTLAKAIVASYDHLLPVEDHPRLFIAVDADKIAPIKAAWDQTASKMLDEFARDEASARSHLLAAYQASAKYDTTICQPQEWHLAPPDALSDMADFASQLRSQFGAQSAVGSWAMTATQTISDAILARHSHDGAPWFATVSPPPLWKFPATGIAIFTDFAPQVIENRPNFSWQAAWYTHTASQGNPYPYGFILPASDNTKTWADLFSRFWTQPITSTTGCIQGFVNGRGTGTLRLTGLMAITSSVEPSIFFSATLHTVEAATNPLLGFRVYHSGQPIFEDVVGTGYLHAGISQTVQSRTAWLPQHSGVYTVEAILDVDQRFVEADETDNEMTLILPITRANRVYLPLIGK